MIFKTITYLINNYYIHIHIIIMNVNTIIPIITMNIMKIDNGQCSLMKKIKYSDNYYNTHSKYQKLHNRRHQRIMCINQPR